MYKFFEQLRVTYSWRSVEHLRFAVFQKPPRWFLLPIRRSQIDAALVSRPNIGRLVW